MRFTPAIAAAVLTVSVLAAPVRHPAGGALIRRQLAGEGSACGSVLTDTDSGVGHGVENAENNLAGDPGADQTSGAGGSSKRRRQLAGEGSACDSVLTDTDSGVGHGVENAEDNLAGDSGADQTGGASGGGGSAPPPPPPPPPPGPGRRRRQLDKIAKGAQTLSSAEGTGAETSQTTTELVNVDGQSTGDAATAGAQVGGDEEEGLEQAGSDVPTPPAAPAAPAVPPTRRQLDKVAKGAQTLSNAYGTGAETASTTTELVNVDGTSTGDAANAGAQLGNTEETTLEQAGAAVPKRK